MSNMAQAGIPYNIAYDEAFTLVTDNPMDAARVLATLNNLGHLHDSFGQYRIHQFGGLGAFSAAGGTTAKYVFRANFPITLTAGNVPYNLDVRIAAFTASGTVNTVARACIVGAPFPSSSGTAVKVLVGAPTSSATGAVVIDSQMELGNPRLTELRTPVTQGGATGSPFGNGGHALVRFDVEFTGTGMAANSLMGMASIQVREYIP